MMDNGMYDNKITVPADVGTENAAIEAVHRQQMQLEQAQIESLSRVLQPEVLNPQMKLQTQPKQEQKETICSSVAHAVKQSADVNQEEYATVGRTAAHERLQDLVMLTAGTENAYVYGIASTHLNSAMDYAKTKGVLAAHSATAQELTDSLNKLNGMNGVHFMPYTKESFSEQSGNIYTETLRSNDGKLHLTTKNPDGGYRSREGVSLNAMVKNERADELLARIGQYHTQDVLTSRDCRVLTSDAFTAGESTTASWEHLVRGNYGALDGRLNLMERYNEALENQMMAKRDAGVPEGVLERERRAHTMRSFSGTKEEVERLRNMKDGAGMNIFTDEELKELEECVDANGYFTDMDNEGSLMLRRAGTASKRRIARNALESSQAVGMSTLLSAYRASKTATEVASAATDVWRVRRSDHAEKNVQKLVNRLGDEHSGVRQMERAKARLLEKQQKLGVGSNKELLGKMKERSKRSHDIKEKRKELRRMTRGMDKTQTRIALNELRQQERLAAHGHYSKILTRQGELLQAKLNRQIKMRRIRDKVLSKMPGKGLSQGKPIRTVGAVRNKISLTKQKLTHLAIRYILPIAAFFFLVFFLIACAGEVMTVIMSPFVEENGNTDENGTVMNDLELVNRGMSEYETAMQANLLSRVEDVVTQEYTVSCGSCGYSIPPAGIEVTFDIRDEFGNPTSICNCMQIVSLYRYYYLFMDSEDEAEDSAFWLNDFKSGRMTDAWDRTHYVTKTVRGKDSKRTWTDEITCTDLDITYETYPVLHGCGNPPSVTTLTAYKNIRVTVPICVDSKLESIAQGSKLRTMRSGVMSEITWQEFLEEGTCDILNDLLGTYEEFYQQGYETYADFCVYFGNVADMMSDADIEKVFAMITDVYGELSDAQRAVITTALLGCGKFSYSMAAHGNSGCGVTGGATDCSGYMSWVHNNCGLYQNTSLSNTTTTWSLAPGHKANNVAALKPGDLIVKGEPGAASASEGNSNHVVMFIGILTDPDTGHTSPWIIECGGSARNSHVKGDANKIYGYKTAVPLGSSDTW